MAGPAPEPPDAPRQGVPSTTRWLAAARRAVDLAYTDPIAADTLAVSAISGGRQADDPDDPASVMAATVAAVAARARGMAATSLGRLAVAAEHLRDAARWAAVAGDRRVRAEVALSAGWLAMLRGEPDQALRHADAAAAGLDGVDAARAAMLRGLVLAETGRSRAAEQAYGRALDSLRHAGGDELLGADIRTNRSIVSIVLGHVGRARKDLDDAEAGYLRAGHPGRLALVRHNQALLADRVGDLPAALRLYGEAEQLYNSAGRSGGLLPVERADTLLAARLVPEAVAAAGAAAAEFTAAGNHTDAVQALILLARARLADDDPVGAKDAALSARGLAGRQRRPAWAALAASVAVQADLAAGTITAATRRLAAAGELGLRAAGWPGPAAELRIARARLALTTGGPRQARQLLGDGTPRRGDAAQLRASGWHAEALVRLAEGRPAAARSALRAGLQVLENFRAPLAAELRASAAGHAVDLTRTGVEVALSDGDPAAVLLWSERGRAIGLRLPSAPATDPVLLELTARLRAGVAAGGFGVEALERAVRDRARTLAGTGVEPPIDLRLPDLTRALGDRALIEYVATDRTLLAVVVVAGSPVRLVPVPVPADLDGRVDALRHALRSAAAGRSATAWNLAGARAARLDDLLLGPVREFVDGRRLVLAPTRALHAVPWSALPTCASTAVTVCPSAALWLSATRRPARSPGGPVLLAAGPGLDGAVGEIDALAGRRPGAVVRTGEQATVESCLAAMNGAAVAHLAAHGVFRSDNPLFSRLELADGPVTGFDLQRLTLAPELVVLSACGSGVAAVRPGDELLGPAAMLLSIGTATVVCTSIPIPDRPTTDLMVAFHDHLLAGLEPAAALCEVRAAADGPVAGAAAAGFECLGAG